VVFNAKGSATRYFDGAPPRIFAHRGLAVDAPENTLLAFAMALAAGAHYLETDVHATADGVAVISHDADLLRSAGRVDRVDSLALVELQKVDLGAGQTYCTLAEALAAFPEAMFNIDVKAERAVVSAVDAIRNTGASDRVLVTSFSDRRRSAAVRMLPGVATSASARIAAAALLTASIGLTPACRRILQGIRALQLPEQFRGFRVITPRLVKALHKAGVEVHVWTVNDPADMSRLLDWGVDGLVTDRVDLALKLLSGRRPLRE
jgi:glycerophosphoryl diester phosphodiesterase